MHESKTHRVAAIAFGLLFIVAFLSYGTGSTVIASVTSVPDFLTNVHANESTVVIGALLMAVVHTFANIALPIIVLPILSPYNRRLAYGYLAAAVAATVVLVVGAIFLLLLIPLANEFTNAGSNPAAHYITMGVVLKSAGVYAYHMGMALWAIGGLMFCTVLVQSRLLPRLMGVWGLVGYMVLLSGSVLEIFGHNDMVEIVSVVPGGLFEVTLSIWLIVSGFSKNRLHPSVSGSSRTPKAATPA